MVEAIAIRLEAIAIRLEAYSLVGWRPSPLSLGWKIVLLRIVYRRGMYNQADKALTAMPMLRKWMNFTDASLDGLERCQVSALCFGLSEAW